MIRKLLRALRPEERPEEPVDDAPKKRISPLLWRDCPNCGARCCGEHNQMLYIAIRCNCGWRFQARNEYYNELHPDHPYYD
jgi:hypothetical protein